MAQFLYALTEPNINRFAKLFNCQNQEKMCNNITKDPTTPRVSLHYLVKYQCLKKQQLKRDNRKRVHYLSYCLK